MLPIRFASVGLRCRLGVLLLLLLLGGVFLGSGQAEPLKGLGVDQFKELIDSKNDPRLSRKAAATELTAYRRKVRQATKDLPSLGEAARVLLLSEWNLIDIGSESPNLVKQVREAVRHEDDDSFQRAIQNLMATASDSVEATRTVLAEIKHEARLQLLERLETRLRFYLRRGRTEDRIAAANLISDTMSKSRSQDRQEALTSLAMIQKDPTRRETTASARSLRERLATLAGDLRALVADADPQVQVAGIRALSDLEIPPEEFVAAVKPKLTSQETPLAARRAAAEALGHALSPVLEALSNLLEESRPEPRVKTVEQILPTATVGLADADPLVRGSCLIACERSARILDELTRDPRMPPTRGVLFEPAIKVVTEVLPQINNAARDSVPALRVRACRVLETLALSSLRLRNLPTRPPSRLQEPLPEPSKRYSEPPKNEGRNNKGASLSPSRRRGRSVPARPAQWAADRLEPPVALPLAPRPLAGESSAPAVTLERPIKLPDTPVVPSGFRVPSPNKRSELRTEALRPVSFMAQQMDDLPAPTPIPIPGFWKQTVQTMITNLSDPDYRVRLGALDVLETFGERAEEAIPALVKALCDSNKFVRWGAARTLGRLAPRRADTVVAGLVGLLNDREDNGVRETALHALENYGVHAKQAAPHLARVLNRGDKDYILDVLHTIQSIGTDAALALPNVAWLLSDRTQPTRVRVESANTLGRFGELSRKQPNVLSILRDVMLNDPDAEVRNAASAAVLAIDRPLK